MQLQKTGAESLAALIDAWKHGQVHLPKVVRFTQYVGQNPRLRRQDTLAHVHGLALMCSIMLNRLSQHVPWLDKALFLQAVIVHDMGEGELGNDVIFLKKSSERDLEEYLAFKARFIPLGESDWMELQRAFLLQFADARSPCFPEEERAVMAELHRTKKYEAVLFSALESFDYLLYAAECFLDHGDGKVLYEVSGRQVPRLDEFAQRLPGFSEEVWTPQIRRWYVEFRASYESSRQAKEAAV